ncbi:tetratricopeptide repeat protein [Nitrogeniibacter aestuarii]|uniref:tetratricopeptide repeat protein n=1 Tax=Nitrogeniibacter aestuarii TaxID=2815343 RepID=UPI001D114491|nr:tetratricopeptide repeat protein [Nitrogeniibacter aestuarii]
MSRRTDTRVAAGLGSGVAILALGAVIAFWPSFDWLDRLAPSRPLYPTQGSRSPKGADALKQQFRQGVLMLHMREYEHAMVSFHRVLAHAPELPEAHVNMGYALTGLSRWAEARHFFASAIELNPQQANAYFGLAITLDALQDRPGAIGAMRTYIHLAGTDDPFRRKAEAALWEWTGSTPQTPLAFPNPGSGLPNTGTPEEIKHADP